VLAFGVPMGASAQQAPALATATAPAVRAVRDYEVGPGDLISIMVYSVPELNQSARVSNSGKIHITRVGVVNVYRKTAQQIASLVSEALVSKGLLNEPWVQVQVTDFRSNTVYVLGEVNQPGQYAITSRMSLLDLISMAAGLTPEAEPSAFLYRLPEKSGRAEGASGGAGQPDVTAFTRDDVLPIDVVALSQGKKPELNVELRGGDVLYVRRSKPKYFFVVGEVSRPGLYEISEAYENKEAGAPLLLSQALSRAGGPVRTAKASKCLLVRTAPGGGLEQRPFDFDAVLQGRQPDWPIEVNDIIFVPGSNAKTVAYGLLGMLPQIVVAGAQERAIVR
jgi:polysaccharide export outer membrane protein